MFTNDKLVVFFFSFLKGSIKFKGNNHIFFSLFVSKHSMIMINYLRVSLWVVKAATES